MDSVVGQTGAGGRRFTRRNARKLKRFLRALTKAVRGLFFGVLLPALWLGFPAAINAASPFSEAFVSGENGWAGSVSGTPAPVISHVPADQNIRLFFAGNFPNALPFWLVGESAASGGAFVGNYTNAMVSFISFDFMAEVALPSELILRLTGPEGTYNIELKQRVEQVGVWYRFSVRLDSQLAGGWGGNGINGFESFLADVTQVRFQVKKNGSIPQGYRFDNIALERVPVAAGLSFNAAGAADVSWDFLSSGTTYRVQASSFPVISWSDLGSFTASGSLQTIVDPDADQFDLRVYRLIAP